MTTPAAADEIRVPDLFAEIGFITERVEPRVDAMPTVSGVTYRVVSTRPRAAFDAFGGEARVGLAIGPHAELGTELELAGLSAPPLTVTDTADGTVRHVAATLVGMTGFAGARLPLGRIELGAELHAGVRMLSIGGAGGHVLDLSETVVQARARAELFVSDRVAVGAFAGTSVLATGEYLGGIAITYYNCQPGHASLAGCRRSANAANHGTVGPATGGIDPASK